MHYVPHVRMSFLDGAAVKEAPEANFSSDKEDMPMENDTWETSERTFGEKVRIFFEVLIIVLYFVYMFHCWGLYNIPAIDRILGKNTTMSENFDTELNEFIGWIGIIPSQEADGDGKLNDWAAWHISHPQKSNSDTLYEQGIYEADGDQ